MGLNPVHPQKEAGIRMDPPMSDPIPIGLQHEEINPASPPDEPPVVLEISHGFFALP